MSVLPAVSTLRRRGLAGLLAIVLTGCGYGYPELQGLVPVPAPRSVWLQGFSQAERCSGRRGDVNQVTWYVVEGDSFGDPKHPVIGLTRGHKIYLASHWANEVWLARHESLHALGFYQHTWAVFVQQCRAYYPSLPNDSV